MQTVARVPVRFVVTPSTTDASVAIEPSLEAVLNRASVAVGAAPSANLVLCGDDSCEDVGKCTDYIAKHRSRMRYPEFRQQGLCVGSGVVEAGCGTVVGRLKRSGMYWTVRGANAILALRCSVLSGNYEDFWAERAENPPIQAEIQS